MNLLEGLSHPLWRAWSETLLHFLWQGTLLGLTVAVMLDMLRPRTASQRYAVLLTTLLLMAACLPITFAVVAQVNALRPAAIASADVSPAFITNLPGVEASREKSALDAALVLTSLPEPDELSRWIVAAWSVGVVLLSMRILASWIGMRLLARGSQPVSDALVGIIARLSGRLELRRVPPAFVSGLVIDATVVGFLKPMVLLPVAWVLELSPEMLEAVLAHELAHIRRHDLWFNLAQRVIETVLFYHPAVWWVSRRLRAEREMCCDELAVSITHQRLVYVTALESVARRRAGQVKPALAVTLGDHEMALLKRIQHILGFSPASPSTDWWPAALAALALPAALWFGWTAFAPGTTAVADEGATVANTFKSGMSDYDANLVIGNLAALPRHRGMFAAATENADEATPAKSEVRDKEERPALPGDLGPDGLPGPPPGDRPAAGRPAPMGEYGRGAGFDRGLPGMAKEGSSPGRRENVRLRDADDDVRPRGEDDDRPDYGRAGVPGAAAAAGRVRMPMGRRGPPRSRLELGDDDVSDARTRRPAATGMRGDRGADMPGRINSPRGRHDDEDKSGSINHEAAPQEQMVRLLRDLHREVEQLRREVRELRDQRRLGSDRNRDAARGAVSADEPRRELDEDEREMRMRTPGDRPSGMGRRDRRGEGGVPPDGRRPGGIPRQDESQFGRRGDDEDDRPAGRPEKRPDAPPPLKGGEERHGDGPPRGA